MQKTNFHVKIVNKFLIYYDGFKNAQSNTVKEIVKR